MKKILLLSFFSTAIICNPFPTSGQWARKILEGLTLDQKIGQLFMVAAIIDQKSNDVLMQNAPYNMDPDHIELCIKKYHVGGMIFHGTCTPEKQMAATNYYQSLSSIPLLIGQDLEWGLTMRLRNTLRFPYNVELGKLKNNELIYKMGKEIGKQCKQLGVHMNFAPVVDVNNNPNNPVIGKRSFGDDPENVAQKGIAFMRGLQDVGIIACAKHFPGHGDTDMDSHFDLPKIPHARERLDAIELYPFRKMIEAGVQSVMLAHLEIPALDATKHLPSSLSYAITTKLLQHELGFQGLVITDGLGMQGVLKHHKPGELELKALLAGHDILLCPMDVPKAVELIKLAIADGRFSEQKLDRRVYKILLAKEWAFSHREHPEPGDALPPILEVISDVAKQLQRELYAAILN